jgi:hypothetical protein
MNLFQTVQCSVLSTILLLSSAIRVNTVVANSTVSVNKFGMMVVPIMVFTTMVKNKVMVDTILPTVVNSEEIGIKVTG